MLLKSCWVTAPACSGVTPRVAIVLVRHVRNVASATKLVAACALGNTANMVAASVASAVGNKMNDRFMASPWIPTDFYIGNAYLSMFCMLTTAYIHQPPIRSPFDH